jgi:hypothetical protein
LEQHWLLAVHDVPAAWQPGQSASLGKVQTGPQQPSLRLHAGQVNTHPLAGLQLSVVQVIPSLQVIATFEQTPPEQLSVVHALLSLQLIGVNTQPVAGAHVSVVQRLLSLHVMGVKTQPVAGLQVSAVQRLLSLHVMDVKTQPVAGLHVSVVHAFESLHVIAVCAQVPDTHVSFVHALPSSHWGSVVQPVGGAARLSELMASIRPQPKLLSKPAAPRSTAPLLM